MYIEYTSSKLKTISTTIINRTVCKEISNLQNIDDMIIVTKNKDNEIQMIDFNSTVVNKILVSITDSILMDLKSIENGSNEMFSNSIDIYKYSNGIIYEVPIGTITNNIFLGSLGFKVPVKLSIIGDVISNVNTKIKEYGINNALIEISINVSVNEKVVVPFTSQTINVSMSVPIYLKLIQGNIPIYYGNGLSRDSNILYTCQ